MARTRWELLSDLIQERSYRIIAEIGVLEGQSTRPIISSCELDAYFLVDPYVSEALYRDLHNTAAVFMKMTSQQAAPLIADESLGLVFIDVDPHDYESCSRDIGLWLPKVRKGGILSGDDYGENFPGVIRAVNEQFSNINVEVDAAATSKSVWWVLV